MGLFDKQSNDYSTVPEWHLHAAEWILGFDKKLERAISTIAEWHLCYCRMVYLIRVKGKFCNSKMACSLLQNGN
jgi:hypothetical protein